MIPKNPQQWARIDRFLMSFSPKEKVAIIHDSDPDGLCSAVIMSKMLERLRGKPADFHWTQPKGTRNTVHPEIFSMIKKKKVTKVIFTDLPVHEDPKAIKQLEKHCQTLIIDHHTFAGDVTSEKTVLAMPQLLADDIDSSRYCASKIAYDLANRHVMVEDISWVASIGMIGDMTGAVWPDFLKKVFDKHKFRTNPKDWFHTEMGTISGMIFAAMTIDSRNVNYCFDAVFNASEPRKIMKDKKLNSLRRAYDKEINVWIQRAPKAMEKNDKLKFIWYEVKPKYRVNSPIATILSLKPQYHDWVILIVEPGDKEIKLSARCQSRRVAVNQLLKNATKGLKGAAGGGHVPAAGANVQKKDKDVFKQRILDALSKNLYTHKENNKHPKR